MKYIPFLLAIALVACNAGDQQKKAEVKTDTVTTQDTVVDKKEIITEKVKDTVEIEPPIPSPPKVYANERFKEVTVKKIGAHKFLIKGKGQIFEANFSWVVEDGHEEIKRGYQMTDAGAPEWGNFSFTVDVVKKRPNSTLHLILFEASAKDGSRQYELPVFLY
jgi:hypothetical protein